MRRYYLTRVLITWLVLGANMVVQSTDIFDFSPARKSQSLEELDAEKSVLLDLNKIFSVKSESVHARLSIFGARGFVDFALADGAGEDQCIILIRCIERNRSGVERSGYVKVEVEREMADMIVDVCQKMLLRTSYSAGTSSFSGLDGVMCELVTDLMAGVCYDPPGKSLPGRFIKATMKLSLKMAEKNISQPERREVIKVYGETLKQINDEITKLGNIIVLQPSLKESKASDDKLDLNYYIERMLTSDMIQLGVNR